MFAPHRATCPSALSSPSEDDLLSACPSAVGKTSGDSPDAQLLETLRSSALSTAAGSGRPEPELEIAELEIRLRDFTTRLITPVARRQTSLEQEIQELRFVLEQGTHRLKECEQVAKKMHEQAALTNNFREELSKWEIKMLDLHAEAAANAARIQQELDDIKYSQECGNRTSHSMQRTLDRMVGELSRLQESSNMLRQFVDKRLTDNGKVLVDATTHVECKITELESRCNRADDDFFALRSRCTSAINRLDSNSQAVASLTNDIQHMQREKAGVSQLEALQQEVNTMVSGADASVMKMLRTMNSMVDDMKEHFETAANAVAVNTDVMLAEVRSSSQEAAEKASQLRNEAEIYMTRMEGSMQTLESWIQSSQEEMVDMMRKALSDLEHRERSQKFRVDSQEASMQNSQEQLTSLRGTVDVLSGRMQSLVGILSTLLQCESASSALDVQDCSDRANVALVGFADSDGTTGRSHSNPRSAGKSGRAAAAQAEPLHGQAGGGNGHDVKSGPVMSIDSRCLSCSAHKQHVLAGFKIACMQYAPGPVHFSDKMFMRQDLLTLREDLIQLAHQQLQTHLLGIPPENRPSSRRVSRIRESVAGVSRTTSKNLSVKGLPQPSESLKPLQIPDSSKLDVQHAAPRAIGSSHPSQDALPALTPR